MFFYLYRDKAQEYRWTLFAENDRKVADSAEGYTSKQGALHGIALIRSTSGNTPIREG